MRIQHQKKGKKRNSTARFDTKKMKRKKEEIIPAGTHDQINKETKGEERNERDWSELPKDISANKEKVSKDTFVASEMFSGLSFHVSHYAQGIKNSTLKPSMSTLFQCGNMAELRRLLAKGGSESVTVVNVRYEKCRPTRSHVTTSHSPTGASTTSTTT